MPTSTAVVKMPTPSKYMVRLAKHFEHRITVERDDKNATFNFPDGVCQVVASDSELTMTIDAKTQESLVRYQEVVGRHLLQVAAKEAAFEVDWSVSG
jgi:uncharacterized protein